MKLHLPTTLRAALIAAMVLCSVPSAFAEEFDPSAARYASGYTAYSGHDELDKAGKNEGYRRVISWDDLEHVEAAESWGLTLHGEGWSASSGNFVLGWTTDYAKAADALGKDELTVTMTDGFVVALTGGKAIVATPSADGKNFKGPAFRYQQGVIADLHKADKNITLDLNFFYDGTTQTLTLNGGSFTLNSGTVVEVTEQSWHAPMPGPGYFLSAGLSNSDGASSDWSFFVPSDELRQWDIIGRTSLDRMKAGDTYFDTETGTTRALADGDIVNFAGGVIFAETSQSLSASFIAGNTPAAFGKTNMVGLGAAEGQTLTVTSGDSALFAAATDGLNIVGKGTVVLQCSSTTTAMVQGLAIEDGATLRYVSSSSVLFLTDGTGLSKGSTLISEGGGTVELQAAEGADITIGTLTSSDTMSSRLHLYSTASAPCAYTIGTLNIGHIAEVGTNTALTVTTVNGGEGSSLNMYGGSRLTAGDVTVGSLHVDYKPTTISGTLSAENFSMGTDIVRLNITGKDGNAFTATKVATEYDRKSIFNAATLADAELNFAAPLRTEVNISGDTSNTLVHVRGMGLEYLTIIDTVSTAGGMKADNKTLTVGGNAVTNDITLSDYAMKVGGDLTARNAEASGASLLTSQGALNVDNLTLADSSAAAAKTMTVSNAVEMGDESKLSVTEAMTADTVTIGDDAVLTAGSLNAGMLSMSGEGATLIAKHLELAAGNIVISSVTRTLPAMVAMEDVVMENAVLTTHGGTTSGITGTTPGAGTLTVGSDYTLTGVTEDGSPAALDVMLLNLADNATLQNFAVGSNTVVSATGMQRLDAVAFAGGYNKMSFDGGTTPFISIPADGTLDNGSTLESLVITGTAQEDKLAADFITINGEGLYFDAASQTYTILSTGNGVALDFDAADVDKSQFNIAPYTIASLSVTNNGSGGKNLVITGREAKEEIMDSLRSTPNRTAAMDNLDAAMQAGAEGQLINLFNYVGDVYHPTLNQRQAALSAASGASLANLSDAQRRGIEDVQQNLRNRIVQMGGQGEGVLRGGWDHADIQAWVQADGAYHTLGQNGDKAGYDTSVYGATAGANLDLNEHWTVGAALSVENGSLKGKGADNLDADTLSCYVNFFGRYQKGHWTHMGIFTIGMDDVDTKRTVLGMTGDGSTSGTSFSAYYELGYIFTLDDDARQIIQPILNVSLTSAKMGSFTESGSIGTAGLKYDSNNLFYGNVGIGARYQAVLSRSVYERNTVLELRAQLNEHFGDTTDEADLTFIGGGNQFTAKGADSGDFGVQLGTGLSVPVGLQTTLFGDADAEFRSHQTDFRANIGVRYDF